MEATLWLKVEGKKKFGRWGAGFVHAFKTKPSIKTNAVAVRLILEIPDALFEERIFEVKAKLPAAAPKFPASAEIAENVAEALSKQFGVRVRVDMPPETLEAASA